MCRLSLRGRTGAERTRSKGPWTDGGRPRGPRGIDPDPVGRIRNARFLLITSATIMSVFLLGSAFIVAALIPPEVENVERDALALDPVLFS